MSLGVFIELVEASLAEVKGLAKVSEGLSENELFSRREEHLAAFHAYRRAELIIQELVRKGRALAESEEQGPEEPDDD